MCKHRSLFFLHILLLDSTCFGLTGHLQVCRLLWLRILLLTAKRGFSSIVASGCFGYVGYHQFYLDFLGFTWLLFCNVWYIILELLKVYIYIQLLYKLSRVRGCVTNTNRFWIGWFYLLTPYIVSSYIQAIQRHRWFTQFTVHRYTRTRILSLH
jgi:hypothetical protein